MNHKYLVSVIFVFVAIVALPLSVGAVTTETPTPELFGVRVSTEYAEGVSSLAFDFDGFTSQIPTHWQTRNARYEIHLRASQGGEKKCDYRTSSFMRASVTFKRLVVTVRVTDLTTDTVVATESFRGNLPGSCPRSYTFRSYNNIPLGASEWRKPSSATFRSWLGDTISLLPEMPSTPTPTLTFTPRPTQTPGVSPTPTPVSEGAVLKITGPTVILDENNRIVGRVAEGEYAILGVVEDRFEILFEGERAYIRAAASSVSVINTSD